MGIYKVWRAGLDSALASASITNGTILVTTDTNRLLVDYNDTRFEITDFVKDTEANILAVVAPLSKFYYATDTHKLYYYDDEWVSLTAEYTHPDVTASDTTSTASPSHGGTVTVVDAVTRDSSGHVTGVNTKTVTLPSDSNTDTLVTQTSSTTSGSYPLLAAASTSPTSGSAATAIYNTGVTVNPSTKAITATTFTGSLSGNATSATKATQDGSGNTITTTYAPLASPALTGTPTAPTASAGTNTTQVATTAFVTTAVANVASSSGATLGYATCSTAASTTAKTATFSGFTLTAGSMIAVTFTYAVPASATLNISSTGAKSMYHMGSAIKADVIQAGATALFVYTGSYYYLLAVDTEAGGDYIDEDA